MKICCKEKISMQKENEGGKITAEKIVEYSQNDYRKLFSILQELTIFNKFITLNDVENYCSYSKKKDVDTNIYMSTSKMLIYNESIGECLRMYNSDKKTYPLMIQENYPTFITDFCAPKNYKTSAEISRSIAFGDLVDNYIFSDQNWDMVEVHGFFSCVLPSHLLFKINRTATLESLLGKLKYPLDFNRTSIKQINRRNVYKTSEYLTNFEIHDFINAGELLNKLIEHKRIHECVKLIKPYGIDEKILDSLLKINKIMESKSAFPSQLKRKFSELLKK